MSYCDLTFFRDGRPAEHVEFRNSWCGVARIWDALFKRHIEKQREHDSWLFDEGKRVWALWDNEAVPDFARRVLGVTFDNAIVGSRFFPALVADLRRFERDYDAFPSHLDAWVQAIEARLDMDGVGLYATSVSRHPWFDWDEEAEESTPYDTRTGTRHWDPYAEFGAGTTEEGA